MRRLGFGDRRVGGQKAVILQVLNTITGAQANGTTVMAWDDTIPVKTEGDEWMTLTIQPGHSSNLLRIDVVLVAGSSITGVHTAALFQDTTTNALAAASFDSVAGAAFTINFTHWMAAGTVASTTFKVRSGENGAGTTTFNGIASGRKHGGISASSITITEIAA